MSHLFFTKASVSQARIIQQVLEEFCLSIRQKVSLSKPMFHVSSNVKRELSSRISDTIGIQLTSNLGKYLLMPSIHTRVTMSTFKFLLNKVYSRLTGWKPRYLSMACRTTLIKSISFSILAYVMQTVELPKSIYDVVHRANRRFLWGDSKNRKNVHLLRWDEVCKPKSQGGLGIRSMRQANTTLLSKLVWRLLTLTDSL